MADPVEAHARRGAPFTFDPVSLKSLIERVKAPLREEENIIYAPSFDHAIKDPVEDDIKILSSQRVLIFEGHSPPRPPSHSLRCGLTYVERVRELLKHGHGRVG